MIFNIKTIISYLFYLLIVFFITFSFISEVYIQLQNKDNSTNKIFDFKSIEIINKLIKVEAKIRSDYIELLRNFRPDKKIILQAEHNKIENLNINKSKLFGSNKINNNLEIENSNVTTTLFHKNNVSQIIEIVSLSNYSGKIQKYNISIKNLENRTSKGFDCSNLKTEKNGKCKLIL
jgi:hypothetical protein